MSDGRDDRTEPPDRHGDGVTGPGTAIAGEWTTPGQRERLVRIGHVLGVVLLVAFVLPFVLYAVPQLIGAEYSYVVLSGSMQPALGAGDVTFVDEIPADVVEGGDVINYKSPTDDRTTTHRVVEVVETDDGSPAFRTKGDNNEDPDPALVTAGELRGRVMHLGGAPLAIPFVGHLLQFTSTGPGFVLLFVIPVVLLVANEVWTVVSTARESDTPLSTVNGSVGDGSDAASDTSVSAPSPADPGPPDGDNGDPETISFSPSELRLGMAVLTAFVTYSLWIAATDPSAFTIGVAGSATVGLSMLAGLYWRGSPAETPTSGDEPAQTRDGGVVPIRTGELASDASGFARESVPALAPLVDIAEARDARLYRSPDGSRYHVSVGATVYVHDADGLAAGTTNVESRGGGRESTEAASRPDTGTGVSGDDEQAASPDSETVGGGDRRASRGSRTAEYPLDGRSNSNAEADDD